MAGLIFSYTDMQAGLIPRIEEVYGEKLVHIGRRTKPIASPSVRNLRGFKPFMNEGDLAVLPRALEFETAHLGSYVDQMTRYNDIHAKRAHKLQDYYEYRDEFHLTTRKILTFFQAEGIDRLLFFNVPHTGDDYLFYRVAEWIGLPVVMLFNSLFNNCFFSCKSLEGFGRLTPRDDVEHEPGIIARLDEELRAAVQIYMGGSYKNLSGQSSRWDVFASWLILLNRLPWIVRNPSKMRAAQQEVLRIKQSLGKFRRTRHEIGHGRKAEAFLSYVAGLERDIDALPENIIYFAMHYQPEMTSSPMGLPYNDQALLIEELSTKLPEGYALVAKENPLQVAYHRSPEFIQRVSRLPNVIMAHPQMNSQALMEKSALVATLTGTVGWEAIKAGKPCLTCGYAWYADCPGVTRYAPDTDLADAMAVTVDAALAEVFVSHLMAGAHEGVVYEAFFRDTSAAFKARNKENLAQLFSGLMKGEIATTYG